jgi:hypothetical protein
LKLSIVQIQPNYVVADALSRRADHESASTSSEIVQVSTTTATPVNVNHDSTSLLDQLKQCYQSDEQCQWILQQSNQQNDTHSEWNVIDGLIYNRRKQLLVPNNEPLRTRIIYEQHDEPTASHRSMVKTLELIQRHFY